MTPRQQAAAVKRAAKLAERLAGELSDLGWRLRESGAPENALGAIARATEQAWKVQSSLASAHREILDPDTPERRARDRKAEAADRRREAFGFGEID